MSLYPQAPQGVGQVLDSGLNLYRKTLKQILPLTLGVAVVGQLPQLFPLLLQGTGGSGAAMAVGLVAVVAFLAWFVVNLSLYGGWLRSMDLLARGQPGLGLGAAFAAGFRKIGSALGATILFVLAVAGGMLLLLVPGIILMTSLFFYWYLIMLEDRTALASLKESHRLVWGNWWRTATVFLVGGLIYAVGLVVVGGIAGMLIGFGFTGPDPGDAQARASGAILLYVAVQVVLNALLLPMWNSMMLVQFRDLQLRKSGSDLAARAAAA